MGSGEPYSEPVVNPLNHTGFLCSSGIDAGSKDMHSAHYKQGSSLTTPACYHK